MRLSKAVTNKAIGWSIDDSFAYIVRDEEGFLVATRGHKPTRKEVVASFYLGRQQQMRIKVMDGTEYQVSGLCADGWLVNQVGYTMIMPWTTATVVSFTRWEIDTEVSNEATG